MLDVCHIFKGLAVRKMWFCSAFWWRHNHILSFVCLYSLTNFLTSL